MRGGSRMCARISRLRAARADRLSGRNNGGGPSSTRRKPTTTREVATNDLRISATQPSQIPAAWHHVLLRPGQPSNHRHHVHDVGLRRFQRVTELAGERVPGRQREPRSCLSRPPTLRPPPTPPPPPPRT